MKKFLAALTAAVMIFSVSAFSVYAEKADLAFYPEFSVDNAKAGDTFYAYIKWKNNPDLVGWSHGTIWVKFDNTKLNVTGSSVADSTIVMGEPDEEDEEILKRTSGSSSVSKSSAKAANSSGEFGFTMAFSYPLVQDESGIVGKITFKVLDGAEFGETLLNVYGEDLYKESVDEEYEGDYPACFGGINIICSDHQFGAFSETKPASCLEDNVGFKVCSVCGYKEICSTVPKLGHSWNYSSVNEDGIFYHSATCQRAGCTAKVNKTECTLSWSHDNGANTHSATCSVCKLKQTVDCTLNWSETTAPTWKDYGVRECDCPVCNNHYKDTSTLVPGTVKAVTLAAHPTKTSYAAGETFNPAGMKVTVSYTNTGYADTVVTDFSDVTFTEKKTGHGVYEESFILAGKTLKVTVNKVSETNISFSADTVTGKPGDTVYVTVSWSGNDKQINGATAFLDFDNSKLEVVSITKGSGVVTSNAYDVAEAISIDDANENGFASFLLATENAQGASGELYKVGFKIKSGTASCDIPLNLRVEDVISVLGDVNAKDGFCTDGKITVKGGLIGDANGNGTVDTADATAILKYILKEATVDMYLADCDGHKGVDTADATAILKYILKEATLTSPKN